MKKLIGTMTEKEYRDILKSTIRSVERSIRENLPTDDEIFSAPEIERVAGMSIDEIQNLRDSYLMIDEHEFSIALACKIFLRRYPDLNDGNLKNIIGSRLPKYEFVRELMKCSDASESFTDKVRSGRIEDILSIINENRLAMFSSDT